MIAACLRPVAGVVLPVQLQGMFASAFEKISVPAKSLSITKWKCSSMISMSEKCQQETITSDRIDLDQSIVP